MRTFQHRTLAANLLFGACMLEKSKLFSLKQEAVMRKRLYFVLPDISSALRTADDLLLARVEDRHMYFLAKRGTGLGKLHEAGAQQKSDRVHGAENGLAVGALCGLLVSSAVFAMQPDGLHVKLIFVLLMTLFGALFGFWTGGLVGSSIPNSRLTQFQPDIDAGRVLLMVDVPLSRTDEIQELIGSRHPEAVARGFEPAIPAFP
jgi:hypothetical protein